MRVWRLRVSSARALDMTQTQEINSQYKVNRQNANSSLATVQATLTSMTNMLTKLKSDVITAGNASYSNAERANMASEIKGNLNDKHTRVDRNSSNRVDLWIESVLAGKASAPQGPLQRFIQSATPFELTDAGFSDEKTVSASVSRWVFPSLSKCLRFRATSAAAASLVVTEVSDVGRYESIAGSLAAKKRIAVTSGTLPTHGPLFVVLLLGTVLLVGALTYVPALALGPGVEHLMMWLGA